MEKIPPADREAEAVPAILFHSGQVRKKQRGTEVFSWQPRRGNGPTQNVYVKFAEARRGTKEFPLVAKFWAATCYNQELRLGARSRGKIRNSRFQ